MMTKEMSPDEAAAISLLLHAVRPEWDIRGIKVAVWGSRPRGTAFDVAHAALYAAEDLTIRTPAVIALAGPHWTRGRELGASDPRGPKCEEPGHQGKPAHNCPYCIADRKARPDDAPPVGLAAPDPDQQDINARGARRVRAALDRGAS